MARGMLVAWLAVAVSAAAWLSQEAKVGAQQARKTVWDKVYTDEQAGQGKTTYEVSCAGCHAKDLNGRDGGGQGPELAGNAFTKKWELQTLNQLYTEIKTRMPRNQPASLTSEEYLNLVAYILQANKFPAGDTALTADTALLTSTFIAREASKAAAAPQADHHRHAGAGGGLPAADGRQLDADAGVRAGAHREPGRDAGRSARAARLRPRRHDDDPAARPLCAARRAQGQAGGRQGVHRQGPGRGSPERRVA